jgi:hypothetical protein
LHGISEARLPAAWMRLAGCRDARPTAVFSQRDRAQAFPPACAVERAKRGRVGGCSTASGIAAKGDVRITY